MTSDLKQLDRVFAEYGPEAAPLRASLREEVSPLINSIWQDDAASHPAAAPKAHQQTTLYLIRELSPKTPAQVSLKERALRLSTDLADIQFMLSSQPPDSVSTPFMNVLILWLMFIFAVFSMSSPSNVTLITVLFLCILSSCAAIYLILELGLPFGGLMQVDDASLRSALK